MNLASFFRAGVKPPLPQVIVREPTLSECARRLSRGNRKDIYDKADEMRSRARLPPVDWEAL